ncbi:MAG: Gfo/Idh/MocA family oxidoreductase, partial [Acidobacteria bacterium]|nr:Gfo/Idh/MocA family oxidoreductase [Acidobacteriota bacterium]
YGYWGNNIKRKFSDLTDAVVTWVADRRPERLESLKRRYPAIHTTTDAHELIAAADVDAVVVATPVASHFDLALRALTAGKHVLVEKPLTDKVADAERLVEEARQRKRVLMVDHTFAYTAAVRKIRELVVSGELGEIYYYDSVRINLGLFQPDVNVLWDLAAHDLAIMDFVLDARPVAVSATGLAHVPNEPENLAYLTMFFDERIIAHAHVSWLAPVKVRRTLVGGSRRMVVYDDLEASEKIKVYDRGISVKPDSEDVYQMRIGYRSGDMSAPHLGVSEALYVEAQHFVECVTAGKTPITDGEAGLRVVRLLEAATASMAARGRLVPLKAGAQ